MGFRITGIKEAVAKLDRIESVTPGALAAALKTEAELIMTDSKDHYVPVDTGDLKSSGFVDDATIRGTRVTVELGYNTDYALIVHEDRRGVVPRPGGQGGPKYLERPVRKRADRIGRSVARRLARMWGA